MIRPNDGRHLDSGALLRALDAEGDPADLTTSREHLAGCVACRAELERLEQRSARFSGLVGDI